MNEACLRCMLAVALVLGLPTGGSAAAVVAASTRAAVAQGKGPPLKEQFPWLHSADEISSELRSFVGQCGGLDFDISQRTEINVAEAAGQEVQMDVIRLTKTSEGGMQQAKTRAMLVFGEHARELISPESALHFVKTLCGSGPSAQRASKVLDHVEFIIVPNSNPLSRKKVEDGFYCKRTNEDNVDLNRNFGDSHREPDGDPPGDERYPGPSGFSEPESRIVKALVDEVKPDIYVSVHSGAYLLGTPFGYTGGRAPANEASMLEVLGPISKKYCGGNCPYGNLAKLIHYDNPGCDIDYVAEAGTPFVFTWEIYVGEDFRDRYIQEARMQRGEDAGSKEEEEDHDDLGLSLVQEGHMRARQAKRKMAAAVAVRSRRSSRRLRAGSPEIEEEVSSCIHQFNPPTQEETESVLARWTGAYLELCEEVAVRQQKKQQ